MSKSFSKHQKQVGDTSAWKALIENHGADAMKEQPIRTDKKKKA